ncbi:DNA-binding protein [Paenibacillus sp. 19GGS1-52]|uniref:DNA-binding protein n=1 Tax=Paenibacillus sp. 19GGS1-52 TaxID=2758563 RepID=UPI001EFB8435|nr:DNA-binding protein [Paenibacillus sp. 19GGS1-52]ULO07850.1 DNA-binding protein [Paenibacillus sp. 19GGS1-52]
MEAKLTTLRSEIEKNLSRSGHNLASFAKVSGLNRGSLSAILHGNPPKPVSLGQLDSITKAFAFPEGWLYPLYVEECFSEERVSRRRVEPFLVRCAEIGKQQCIDEILSRILEYSKSLEIIFSVAEKLFRNGKVQESLIFYKIIAANEPDNYSERLAISQYRIFNSLQAVVDAEDNLRAVITFEPFRGRLPEAMQLDGLLKLAKVCFLLNMWKDVEKYADELRALANGVYREELQLRKKNGRRSEELQTERPLVVYYGHGYLLKASALTKLRRYEEAKKYTAGYSDLSWFEMMDEVGRQAVETFRLYAIANSYTLEMLVGNIKALPAYISFLAEHPGEILPGMLIIMESANRYGFSADAALTRFSREILRFGQFQDPINVDRLFRLNYEVAMYLIDRQEYSKGIEHTIQSLQLSMKLNTEKGIIKCVTLFEINRVHASDKQQQLYTDLMKEMRQNEKDVTDDDRSFGIV